MEKERENARMEAKRRRLMEKRVRIHMAVHPCLMKLKKCFQLPGI